MSGTHAPIEERFWRHVDRTGECWIWTASVKSNGYGQFYTTSAYGMISTHRYSAMLAFGMFDRRMLVLHKCDVKRCVRPNHLYLGTHTDNLNDRWRRQTPNPTQCKHGHPLEGDNVIWHQEKERYRRRCRTCLKDSYRRRRAAVGK